LPPKNSGVKHSKYDNYFTNDPNNKLSIMAAKNMNSIVHRNICGGSKSKEPFSLTHTSRHHSSISFSNSQTKRISSRPSQEKNAREAHSKYIKTESKTKSDNGAGIYSTNGYSSSNIIRMLRVKQEVITDPRMGLSKEQLLSRLINMEKEYNHFKNQNENMHAIVNSHY
jgi:hypothetical protein